MRKQNTKIGNTYSVFQMSQFCVPQGSILGSILFNMFIKNLHSSTKNAELHNFADNNTIASVEDT